MKSIVGNCCRAILLLIGMHVCSYGIAQQALQPGDKAPALNVFKWIKGKPVGNWKKGTVYLVEFGATWCTPCAAAMPALQAIQKRYKDSVTVVSLFVQEANREPVTTRNPAYVKYVERYIQKRDSITNYTIGVDGPLQLLNNVWVKGGRGGVPQIFVIDKDGFISWEGYSATEAAKVAEQVLRDEYVVPKPVIVSAQSVSAFKEYDRKKLLLIEGNGGEETNFLFRSVLTSFDGRTDYFLPAYVFDARQYEDTTYAHEDDRFEAIGVSIGELYYFAYGDTLYNVPQSRNGNWEWIDTVKYPFQKKSYGRYWHEPVLEVTDKTPFEFSRKNIRNRYSYSLKVPKGVGTAEYLQHIMRNDLESYFGFEVTVETRSMPYWKLTAADKSLAMSKLAAKNPGKKFNVIYDEGVSQFTTAEMRDMIWMLGSNFGFKSLDYGKLPRSEQAAFIDETGIAGNIDFSWDKKFSFEEAKAYLQTVGLQLTKSERPMKVVVIRDAKE